MNKIIIIRGPLGVGKTTIAKLLADKIGAQYLSLDKIFKKIITQKEKMPFQLKNF